MNSYNKDLWKEERYVRGSCYIDDFFEIETIQDISKENICTCSERGSTRFSYKDREVGLRMVLVNYEND